MQQEWNSNRLFSGPQFRRWIMDGVSGDPGALMFEWILTAMSLAGSWLNIHKKISSWAIWALANFGWVVSFAARRMYAEATLFVVYFFLSLYGIYKWSRTGGEGEE